MARAGLLGRLAAWRRRVPGRVHTFHGHLLQGYFGPFRTRLICRAERLLAGLSTGLVAVSPRVAEELARAGATGRHRVAVIPPALDPSPYLALARRRPAGEGPVVGWAGRLVPVKDPDLLGRVARRLPGVRFLAAGEGPLLSEMRDRHPQVRWLGHCGEMARFYERLDAFLLTSVNEGVPLVLLEAFAAGVPVVATPAGGVADLVATGRTGLLPPDRKEENLAALLARLLADGELGRRLARAGREEAAVYAAGKTATRLATFYRACLAASGRDECP
jgi:glycosyltransferase involved in cell wall biosynthesis